MIIEVRTVSERKGVTVSSFRGLFPTWCFRWLEPEAKRGENQVRPIPFFPCLSFALQLAKRKNRFNQKTWNERTASPSRSTLVAPLLPLRPLRLFVLNFPLFNFRQNDSSRFSFLFFLLLLLLLLLLLTLLEIVLESEENFDLEIRSSRSKRLFASYSVRRGYFDLGTIRELSWTRNDSFIASLTLVCLFLHLYFYPHLEMKR